jgi:hypothetical protein
VRVGVWGGVHKERKRKIKLRKNREQHQISSYNHFGFFLIKSTIKWWRSYKTERKKNMYIMIQN